MNKALTAIAFSCCMVGLLAGCATPSPSPARIAELAEIERTTPTCVAERECEVKWAAARRWVNDNAGYKLQHITPDFIETYNSTGGRIAVRVERIPLQQGYKIAATITCANPFGCVPYPPDAALDFNRTVTESWPPR